MKARKAHKRLSKIETLITEVHEGYAAFAPHVISFLEDAKAAIARAKEFVVLHASTVTSPSNKPTKHLDSKVSKNRSSASLVASKNREVHPASVPSKTNPRKGGLTEEGRKRLADAMKKRWAVKRAASAVKKIPAKKTAAK